jgi:hypothetical protein
MGFARANEGEGHAQTGLSEGEFDFLSSDLACIDQLDNGAGASFAKERSRPMKFPLSLPTDD